MFIKLGPGRKFQSLTAFAMASVAATAYCAGLAPGLPQTPGKAQNPIIQTSFTADPAPLVHKGVVYLYTSHDEDDATGFLMRDWLLYTSTDMVNWTDRGAVASLRNFSWADPKVSGWGGFDNGAWAPQVVSRNGKFYMYCPVQGRGIGVLVADTPFGPFTDPLGRPLIGGQYESIDPTVLVDDDGQAYLYWGNPNLWYVKLNKDMLSLGGEPTKDPSMAKSQGRPDPFHYQEGAWAFKRKGRYYMAYASTCCPEGIGYAMSTSPTGPWSFKGYVMPPDGRSSGNHPGIVDYKGKSYIFGFNYTLNRALTDKHRERRSVCVAQFSYAPDGTILPLPWWDEGEGVAQTGSFDPFRRNEAEAMSWTSGSPESATWTLGVKTEPCAEGGMNLRRLRDGGYVKVSGVDFGRGAARFEARVACGGKGGTLAIHIDSPNGPRLGECAVPNTGGWQSWTTLACPIRGAKGRHDLYLVFHGEPDTDLFNFDWWRFHRS